MRRSFSLKRVLSLLVCFVVVPQTVGSVVECCLYSVYSVRILILQSICVVRGCVKGKYHDRKTYRYGEVGQGVRTTVQ